MCVQDETGFLGLKSRLDKMSGERKGKLKINCHCIEINPIFHSLYLCFVCFFDLREKK